MRHSKYFDVLKLIQAQLEGTASDSVYEEIIKDFVQYYQWERTYATKSEFLRDLKGAVVAMRDSLITPVLIQIQEDVSETLVEGLPPAELRQVEQPPKLYSFAELEEMFRVSRQTIYNWEKEGLKVIRIGGKVRVRKSDLEAFINSRRNNIEI